MPLTFVSHQAPVLPLKIWAPRWFDGTALVIGSMAPDLAFVVRGTAWQIDAHDGWPVLWFCVPVTLALTYAIKVHIAAVMAAHLPDAGSFHLHDYDRLVSWPGFRDAKAFAVALGSAALGAFSHVLFDSFTHGFGWVVERVEFLRRPMFTLPSPFPSEAVHVYDTLQVLLTVLGFLITIATLRYIGRRRLLLEWHPAPLAGLAPTPASRARLVVGVLCGTLLGLVVAGVLIRSGGAQSFMMRTAAGTYVGLLCGCWRARRAMGADPAEIGP